MNDRVARVSPELAMSGGACESRRGPEWLNDHLLRWDGVEFFLTQDQEELHAHPSTRNHFLTGKLREGVEYLMAMRGREAIDRILDIGIFKGGSAALYTKIFEPTTLVAIDVLPTPAEALSQFIDDNGLAGRVKPYYGVEQSDPEAMRRILAEEFPSRNIDLIVDDASHFYRETRATVNLALPYLRPNGLYVIEDWGWAHWPGDVWQKSRAIASLQPALSNLVIELLMLCASRPDIVRNLWITRDMAVLRRGDAALEPDGFDIAKHYLCRDRWFKPIL